MADDPKPRISRLNEVDWRARVEKARTAPTTYRATERGYAEGRIIEPGEAFTTTSPQGSWMEKVSAKEANTD